MKLYETINAENWTKGSFAVTRTGLQVGSRRPGAAKWCLAGHLLRVRASQKKRARVIFALQTLYPERATGLANYPIYHFNDHVKTTLDEVLRACKLADV